jgi:amino acid transporter
MSFPRSPDWVNPGPFAQFSTGGVTVDGRWGQFVAFWSAFVTAAFSFLGTEIVALTAGEAENPRKNVPKAIRRTFWRSVDFPRLSTTHLSAPLC